MNKYGPFLIRSYSHGVFMWLQVAVNFAAGPLKNL